MYGDELTPFEKSEIGKYQKIYYVGSVRVRNLSDKVSRDGFYRVKTGEQIAFRYSVVKVIDAGAFGQVCMCIDIKHNVDVALKLSKNKKSEVENAAVEAKLLKKILGEDPDKHGIVKMLDFFPFRHHFVIVFEFLDKNLYKYIKQPGFKTFDRLLLKKCTVQMLNALDHLKEIGIIHCDLKPENVLFTTNKCERVKIIDFGSACTDFKAGFSYVQSRFYRSPEVVLGLPYNHAVDMWSFGCIISELITGTPLFPAINEKELLEFYIIRIG